MERYPILFCPMCGSDDDGVWSKLFHVHYTRAIVPPRVPKEERLTADDRHVFYCGNDGCAYVEMFLPAEIEKLVQCMFYWKLRHRLKKP